MRPLSAIGDFYEPARIDRIKLDADGIDMACEGANDFAAAGYDDQAQLLHGIKSYLYVCELKKISGILNIREPDTVQIPLNAVEAAMMIRLGQMFLARHPDDDGEPLTFDDPVKNI